MKVNVFIQARMSSSRFPGKVMVDLHGKPIIRHLIDQMQQVKGIDQIVVLTSHENSDDILVDYLERSAQPVFRGDLENVYARFKQALQVYPCDFFVRLCADSPL